MTEELTPASSDPMDQPGYWMEVVRQEAFAKHDCRSIEALQPQKAALALEMLARCDSIRKISRETGLSTSTIQQMKWRHIETLETRNSDRLDFYDVSVWGIRQALVDAFEAGRLASSTNTPN